MPGQFIGLTALGSAISATFLTRNTSNVPTDATTLPTYRVYGPIGVMTNGTGSLAFKDSGTVTGAVTAGGLIKITSVAHKLTTGMQITIASVVGTTEANGNFAITVVDADTFTLDGSTFTNAYVSGGTWHASGLYSLTYTPTLANGFNSTGVFFIVVNALVGSNNIGDVYVFQIT